MTMTGVRGAAGPAVTAPCAALIVAVAVCVVPVAVCVVSVRVPVTLHPAHGGTVIPLQPSPSYTA